MPEEPKNWGGVGQGRDQDSQKSIFFVSARYMDDRREGTRRKRRTDRGILNFLATRGFSIGLGLHAGGVVQKREDVDSKVTKRIRQEVDRGKAEELEGGRDQKIGQRQRLRELEPSRRKSEGGYVGVLGRRSGRRGGERGVRLNAPPTWPSSQYE